MATNVDRPDLGDRPVDGVRIEPTETATCDVDATSRASAGPPSAGDRMPWWSLAAPRGRCCRRSSGGGSRCGLDFVQDDVAVHRTARSTAPLDSRPTSWRPTTGTSGLLWKARRSRATVAGGAVRLRGRRSPTVHRRHCCVADIGMLLALREIFGRGRLSSLLVRVLAPSTPLTVVAVRARWTIGAIMLPVPGRGWRLDGVLPRASGPSCAACAVGRGAVACLALAVPRRRPQAPVPASRSWSALDVGLPRLAAERSEVCVPSRAGRGTLWACYDAAVRRGVPGRCTAPRRRSDRGARRRPARSATPSAPDVLGTALPSAVRSGRRSSDCGLLAQLRARSAALATSSLVQLTGRARHRHHLGSCRTRGAQWACWLAGRHGRCWSSSPWRALSSRAGVRAPAPDARTSRVLLVPGHGPARLHVGLWSGCARPPVGSVDRVAAAPPALRLASWSRSWLFVESAWVTTYAAGAAMKAASTPNLLDNAAMPARGAPVSRRSSTGSCRSSVVFAGFLPEVGATQPRCATSPTQQTWTPAVRDAVRHHRRRPRGARFGARDARAQLSGPVPRLRVRGAPGAGRRAA